MIIIINFNIYTRLNYLYSYDICSQLRITIINNNYNNQTNIAKKNLATKYLKYIMHLHKIIWFAR